MAGGESPQIKSIELCSFGCEGELDVDYNYTSNTMLSLVWSLSKYGLVKFLGLEIHT
jgi:hypothetical protein